MYVVGAQENCLCRPQKHNEEIDEKESIYKFYAQTFLFWTHGWVLKCCMKCPNNFVCFQEVGRKIVT